MWEQPGKIEEEQIWIKNTFFEHLQRLKIMQNFRSNLGDLTNMITKVFMQQICSGVKQNAIP